eukprot:TRINITY_DN23010_c0_g1_i1.p1 TRINITY_DN23010_c0_g1~~TRINITY_DN23010_c0_g1_i1.p1  ORF type:complete len:715 (+),score=128.68 TRINITY_DN23010_c0_g1_i1:43-2187(+)
MAADTMSGTYLTEPDQVKIAWLPKIRPLTGASGCGPRAPGDVTSSSGHAFTSLGLSTFSSRFDRKSFFDECPAPASPSSPSSALRQVGESSTRMRKSQSDSVLHGVSPNAKSENVRARRNLQSLGVGRHGNSSKKGLGSTKDGNASGLDQESTLKEFEKLGSAITEVKCGFDTFDPRRARKQVPFGVIFAGGKAARDVSAGGNGEDEEAVKEAQERLAERLQAYKFSRKFEPELPPLVPLPKGPMEPPRKEPIIVRNASVEAIKAELPARRKDRITIFADEKRERTELVIRERERQIEERADFWEEDLARKRQQAIECVKLRRTQAARKGVSEFPTAEWVTILFATGFLSQVRQDLEIQKMPTVGRLQFVEQNKHKLLIKRSKSVGSHLQEAVHLAAAAESPAVARVFAAAAAVMKLRKQLKQSRENARLVTMALTQWQVAGNVIISIKRVVHNARMIQRFWRQCSARLKEQRERISRRWERLERQELAAQLSKFTRGSVTALTSLSLEDRIQMEMCTKAARLRFLENELRARRYFLLPLIEEWHKELPVWQEALNKYLETKKAYQVMGENYEPRPEDAFRWPPKRPMHLPCSHPLGEEARGAICSQYCPGRKGDEEILDMSRRCRDDPLNWKRVPKAGVKNFDKKKKEKSTQEQKPKDDRRTISMDALLQVGEKDQDFGDAPEGEMKRYGVDASTMPGGKAPSESAPAISPRC